MIDIIKVMFKKIEPFKIIIENFPTTFIASLRAKIKKFNFSVSPIKIMRKRRVEEVKDWTFADIQHDTVRNFFYVIK